MKTDSAKGVRLAQQAWAMNHDPPIVFDKDGYCETAGANLYQGLTASTKQELMEGDGAEFGKAGERGKFQALHSSSALVCNVFDYWRERDLSIPATALGIPERPCGIGFERKFKTGVGNRSPNLDLVFCLPGGRIFGIESKFTEHLTKAKAHNLLQEKYFADGARHWEEQGLHLTQVLANDMRVGRVQFGHLNAAQLLKHMLGLAKNSKEWRLHYLWFDTGTSISDAHREEVRVFANCLGPESARFTNQTYQEFFARLGATVVGDHDGYMAYLKARYFR